MSINNRFKTIIDAINLESKEEESYYSQINDKRTLVEKVDGGFAWSHVNINRRNYTIGEKVELHCERTKGINKSHKLRTGMGCNLCTDHPEIKKIRATIASVRKNRIVLITNSDYPMQDPNSFTKGVIWIELVYDDRPYKVMKEAITIATESKDSLAQTIKEALANESNPYQEINEVNLPTFKSTMLNPSQREAIIGSIKHDRVTIIHGPPGTGKTTTLVELARLLSHTEKKILVSASSNNAVDLMADKINQLGVSLVRVGNITRIDDKIQELTLAEQARNHVDWQHIKKIKIEAEQAQRKANNYKRSFGPEERMHRKYMRQEAKELRKWARDQEDRLTEKIIDQSKVVATTLIGAAHRNLDGILYDTVIIDEASQALEAECWNVIIRAKRLILVGDPMQLPPTVKSKEAEKLGYGITLLDLLNPILSSNYLLNLQYRMNDHLLSFSNETFYDGKLMSADQNKSITLPNDVNPLTFIDTAGCGFDEKIYPKTRSRHNEGEYLILREFILQYSEKIAGHSVGIISPYAEQVRYIRSQIAEDEELKNHDITVESIDGFQGQEKDVIFISLVRSNENGEIGFLKDYRRLNVALTRAKRKMTVLGDMATLSSDKMYLALADHIEKIGRYQSAYEYMG